MSAGTWTAASNGSQGWYVDDFNGGGSDDLLRFVSSAPGADVFVSDTFASGLGGGDHFQFSVGDGQDTIADFTTSGANHDVIELAKALASDFDTVMSHATQVGADTVIAFDASTSITLASVNRSSLTHSDFLFV